jgi:cephalosporin-C deacetylase
VSFAVSIKDICPPLTCADDFSSFWQETLAGLTKLALAIEVRHREKTNDGLLLQHIAFQSFGDAIIHAYLLSPDNTESSPLIVYTHGYMGACEVVWSWARQGFSVFGIDIRGYGQSKDAIAKIATAGYVLTGIESEKNHILRGAICDYIRGIEVAHALLQNKQQATVLYGHSFGGALACFAAGLTQYADLLVAAVPTFAWAEGRRKLVSKGSGAEINAYIKEHPDEEQDVMRVLSYFDIMNFAPLIACSSIIGVGLQDCIVPAETVFAFINHLACSKQVREFPVSHTSSSQEKLWENFEAEWLQLALSTRKG